MNNKFIYLAGPITNRTEAQANDWRRIIRSLFVPGIIGISPLRGESRPHGGVYTAQGDDARFTTPKAIAAKNHYDTHNCDAVLAYLPKEYNDQHPSYGTIFELGWATGIQTPTILVTDDPGLQNHPLINAKVNWIFDNFDDAAEVINSLFEVYVQNAEKD